jgi:hypothetical protein
MPMAESLPPSRFSLPRFQFRLAWIFVLTTVVAIVLWLMISLGSVVLASLVWCVLPTPLVICAIFGRRDRQAFAIGALIPWFCLLVVRVPVLDSFVALTIWLFVLGSVCGVVAVATRRWIA